MRALKAQKKHFAAALALAGLTACAAVPNEGPTGCGLESMDNALYRDEGCDPVTGTISVPSVVLVWVVDYGSCGLKWHNTRIAPDFDGKKRRYLHRLKQLKLEAERDQSALEAQRKLAAETLSVNAIAERVYALLQAKSFGNLPALNMRQNKSAKILAENSLSERFALAFEQMVQIQSNLQLAHNKALAAMPQDQDILPALADPNQNESSSYSVLELEKKAWAEVTEADYARRKAERAARYDRMIAGMTPQQRQAYEASLRQKAREKQADLNRKKDKQMRKNAHQAAKQAQQKAAHQARLAQKHQAEPVPMSPLPNESQPNKSPSSAPQAQAQAQAQAPQVQASQIQTPPAQHPVAPLVRKPETVQASPELKSQIQTSKTLPVPLPE